MTILIDWFKQASALRSSASHAMRAHTVWRRWCVCVCASLYACMYLTPHLFQWSSDVVLALTHCSRKDRMFALFKGEAIKEKAVSLRPKQWAGASLFLLVFTFSLTHFDFYNLVEEILMKDRIILNTLILSVCPYVCFLSCSRILNLTWVGGEYTVNVSLKSQGSLKATHVSYFLFYFLMHLLRQCQFSYCMFLWVRLTLSHFWGEGL